MKRFLILLSILFGGVAYAATETINWYMDGQTYATTTCQTGGDIILPTTPTKRGYTFKGWVNYIPIEYLESTGTQYIDTGVVPSAYTNVLLDMQFTNAFSPYSSTDPGYAINGARQTSSDDTRFYPIAICSRDAECIRFVYGKNQTKLYSAIEVLERHVIDFNNSNRNIILDGKIVATLSLQDINIPSSANAELSLFAANDAFYNHHAWTTYEKIYSCSIKENNILVRDFIPVLDGDGVPCMYDRVEGKFYYNQGTGQFIAGPAI